MLLYQGYRRSKARLLAWSSAFFLLITLENVLLLLDRLTGPAIDLSALRMGVALAGVSILIIGLISERG
jgi:hypothetical protein